MAATLCGMALTRRTFLSRVTAALGATLGLGSLPTQLEAQNVEGPRIAEPARGGNGNWLVWYEEPPNDHLLDGGWSLVTRHFYSEDEMKEWLWGITANDLLPGCSIRYRNVGQGGPWVDWYPVGTAGRPNAWSVNHGYPEDSAQ